MNSRTENIDIIFDDILDVKELSKHFKLIYQSNLYVQMTIGKVPLHSIKMYDIKEIIKFDNFVKDLKMKVEINDMELSKLYYLKFTIDDKYYYETTEYTIMCLYKIIELYNRDIKIEYPFSISLDYKDIEDDIKCKYISDIRLCYNYDRLSFKFNDKENILLIEFKDGYIMFNIIEDKYKIFQLYLDYITFFNETSQSGICRWKHDDRYSYNYLLTIMNNIEYGGSSIDIFKYSKNKFVNDYDMFLDFFNLIGGNDEYERCKKKQYNDTFISNLIKGRDEKYKDINFSERKNSFLT
jgi:hypothetical protein